MELPSKVLEQNAFDTRSKIEEHMLIVMHNSTHEEHLCQPLQTKNKQFEMAFLFLTGYKGKFNVTNSNNKFYFKISITDGYDFIQTTIPLGAYEIEVWIMKSGWLLLMKVIFVKMNIHSR